MQNYMKKSIPVIVLSLCTILFLGCSDDPEVMPQDTIPPNGCFELSIEKTLDRCIRYDFELDASCTVDNLNSTNDIEIRWDFDNDGVFDTGYDTVKKVSYYPSSSIIDSAYVTLAARDRNYNVSLLTQKLDLSELPTSPDLIAGELTIGEFDENLDTVSVGESFLIIVSSTCFGDFLSPKFVTYIYINGEIIREEIGGCSGGFSGCGSSGKPYSINVAGTYELYFDLDATNIYAEIDEMNNQSAKKTLTVIEQHLTKDIAHAFQQLLESNVQNRYFQQIFDRFEGRCHIQSLEILKNVFGEVIITPEIAEEYGLDTPDWIRVEPVNDKQIFSLLNLELDQGESSGIALALENESSLLIVDEKKGRGIAKRLGIKLTGVLGVMIRAKETGVEDRIKPLIEKFEAVDFRISARLQAQILERVGE